MYLMVGYQLLQEVDMVLVTLIFRMEKMRNDDLQLRVDGVICFPNAVVHRVHVCLSLPVQICTVS